MSTAQRAVRMVRRLARSAWRRREARRRGIAFVRPNYIYVDRIRPDSIVIDVGCGYEAEFAQHMITTRGARAIGVDPTRKHGRELRKLEQRYARFSYLPVAIAAQAGTLTFYESVENESGSLLSTHHNVRNDQTRSYNVQVLTLRELVERAGASEVEFLKLDLEGAEYDLLHGVDSADLAPFRQIFVEFHHHAIAERTEGDTSALVTRIESLGLRSFSLDDHNVLFYR